MTTRTPEELIARVHSNQHHERHRNYTETYYWCRQWRLLAEEAVAALTEARAQAEKGERVFQAVVYAFEGREIPEDLQTHGMVRRGQKHYAEALAERDRWLEAFNRSEQFQNGPTKRAEAFKAERDRLREAVGKYGQHTRECSFGKHVPGRGDPNEICTCGFDAALSGGDHEQEHP